MSSTTPEFPKFASILSEDAFKSKLELDDSVRSTADEVERAIAMDPEKYGALSKPIGREGEVLVYEHPGSTLEVTYQVETEKERVLFFRFTDRKFRLRKTIFISYSHKDSVWLKELRAVFYILQQLGEISFWDDEKIRAGEDWKARLAEKLDTANAAVLLVSDAFLDSEFIRDFELPRILEEKKKSVYWIHLSKSRVAEAEPRITALQSLSTNPDITLAEFFEELEREAGPTLTADDHRALVAAVRADRERSDR